AAELEAGVLAGADEVQLGAVRVAARDRVDDGTEPGELVRVDLVPTRAERLHDLARVDEHRHLVRVDDRAREAADGDVRPFVYDLTFAVVRYGDEFPPEQCHGRTIPALPIAAEGVAIGPYLLSSQRGIDSVPVVPGAE